MLLGSFAPGKHFSAYYERQEQFRKNRNAVSDAAAQRHYDPLPEIGARLLHDI
ncbi:MAG: hypothetical protein GDA56_10505 [Hormoscilla sp. GM7CHS1pb]|nr:hypothetical protein [Hormoscilla sp. GM7CHS1pb]